MRAKHGRFDRFDEFPSLAQPIKIYPEGWARGRQNLLNSVVFRSREVANVRITQQYRIDIAQLNTTKDSRNSNK
jgi:hypothetical protein